MELIVERVGDRGAARIPGWVDGKSKAVITWKGTDGDDGDGPFTKEYTTEREAMESLSSIELYVNLELISAELIVEE